MRAYITMLLSLIIIFCSVPVKGENSLNVNVLVAANWGSKEGEFGMEKEGKTELGYALDFIVVKDKIYILDSINNRIQIFDLNGKFVTLIKLKTNWQDFGLPWDFVLFQEHFYMLIGKAPYYSPTGIKEIHKFSYDGKFIKSFGNGLISNNKEEYFNNIISDAQKGYVLGGLGSAKVVAFDAEGNIKDTLLSAKKGELIELMGISSNGNPVVTTSKSEGKIRHTLLINAKSKIIEKDIHGRFTLVDEKGNFIDVHTVSGSKRKKTIMTTTVDIFNSIENKSEKIELKGDIKVSKNGKDRIYRYNGNFYERSRIDSEGNVYHLIALEDGVVLRKLTLK